MNWFKFQSNKLIFLNIIMNNKIKYEIKRLMKIS